MPDNLHVDRALLTWDLPNGVVEQTLLPPEEDDCTLARVIDAVGGPAAWEALPVLDLGEEENLPIGNTGYIDFVTAERMTGPLMRGVDTYGRPFLAVRYNVDVGSGPRLCVETIFRRYRTGGVWTSGGASVLCGSTLTHDDLELLRRLVHGEEVGVRKIAWGNKEVPPNARNVVWDEENGWSSFELGRLTLV